jgi:CDP-glucose 4,6-dehydratase
VYRGKKVFVTGHTGFKGSWLCEWLLLLGAEVYGYSIDALDPSLFNQLRLQQRLFDMRGDVLDIEALRKAVSSVKPDFIFHLAAKSLVRQSYADPVDTFTTNFIGSVNVMEAVRMNLDRCVAIMITTDKCYENHGGLHAYRETGSNGRLRSLQREQSRCRDRYCCVSPLIFLDSAGSPAGCDRQRASGERDRRR